MGCKGIHTLLEITQEISGTNYWQGSLCVCCDRNLGCEVIASFLLSQALMSIELHARALSSWLEMENLASQLTWPHWAVWHQAKSSKLSGHSVFFKIRVEGTWLTNEAFFSAWATYFPMIDMWQRQVKWVLTGGAEYPTLHGQSISPLLPQHYCQRPPFTSQSRW